MAKARVAILVSGAGTNMAALLYASRDADCPYEVVLVAGDNPEAAGLVLAESEGLAVSRIPKPTAKDRSQFFSALDLTIRQAKADYIALAGFMRILPRDFVQKWAGRMINIHPSLLPKYTGLDTHARAIAAQDSHSGCSVHLVTEQVDDGEVLAQTPVAILPGDTPQTLAARVLIAEHQLYPRTLAAFVARERSPDYLIAQVRRLALALPEADEIVSHGMPCFGIIKGKKFAYVSNDHHSDGRIALLVKISGLDEQNHLIETDPDLYYRPAYFGDSWVAIRLDLGDTDWTHIGEWLAKSWRAIAPKKLTGLLDVADEL
ncbi:MAG: phosphoribosylglycinamide formyltransferase [Sphingomonadaceae bacterium]